MDSDLIQPFQHGSLIRPYDVFDWRTGTTTTGIHIHVELPASPLVIFVAIEDLETIRLKNMNVQVIEVRPRQRCSQLSNYITARCLDTLFDRISNIARI